MQEKPNYKLSLGKIDDLEAIQSLLYPEYFEETAYSGMTYDPEMTAANILNWLQNNLCIVAKSDDGKVVGFVSVGYMHTFYKEMEADVEIFIVSKAFRGSGLARDLVDGVVKFSEERGCKIIYTGCLSGIDDKNNSLYVNLWKKYGFKVLGSVMFRS